MSMSLRGSRVTASAGDTVLTTEDGPESGIASGGIGLLVAEGSVSVDRIRVSPG